MAALATTIPLAAHHSWTADYDGGKPITVKGVVTLLNANLNKEVVVRGCGWRNDGKNRYAASFIKLADGTVQRLGQDVEGVFGTRIWSQR